ncbi:hypothetical protein IE53DRAFT_226629 [Violaceomyces palustris]|uniref:Uncharacterized protein n=1 Tax=Violaceomyces palustris TaxID=1673888 RepID=A0ACD0NPX8_9BASI|nr:hypothetical protein IE53DRAFT_226629 [Violaceomyces palustris]
MIRDQYHMHKIKLAPEHLERALVERVKVGLWTSFFFLFLFLFLPPFLISSFAIDTPSTTYSTLHARVKSELLGNL